MRRSGMSDHLEAWKGKGAKIGGEVSAQGNSTGPRASMNMIS